MTESPFKPPEIRVFESDEYSIPFVLENLAANSQNTVVSSMISLKHRIVEVKTYFPDDAINNVRVYWLASANSQGSTTTVPDGTSVVAPFSPSTFIIGHADVVVLSVNMLIESEKNYIKMHVVNNNAYAVTVMGIAKLRKI